MIQIRGVAIYILKYFYTEVDSRNVTTLILIILNHINFDNSHLPNILNHRILVKELPLCCFTEYLFSASYCVVSMC